jgi:hypothetical protein
MTTIFDPTSANFAAASGGMFRSTTGFSSLPPFNSVTGAAAYGDAQFDVTGISSLSMQFVFAGDAGDGSIPFAVSAVPISWNFSFTPETNSDSWSYAVTTFIETTDPADETQTFQDFGPHVGQASITDSMLAATPLGMPLTAWQVFLSISWQSASGGAGPGSLDWDIPRGSSLDVNAGAAVPEPSALRLAIAPLLGGLATFLRRGRRGRDTAV